jgi:hypothetical protein
LPKYKVTVYTIIGEMFVTAKNEKEACAKVNDPEHKKHGPTSLIHFFNYGYNANLHVTTKEL